MSVHRQIIGTEQQVTSCLLLMASNCGYGIGEHQLLTKPNRLMNGFVLDELQMLPNDMNLYLHAETFTDVPTRKNCQSYSAYSVAVAAIFCLSSPLLQSKLRLGIKGRVFCFSGLTCISL